MLTADARLRLVPERLPGVEGGLRSHGGWGRLHPCWAGAFLLSGEPEAQLGLLLEGWLRHPKLTEPPDIRTPGHPAL